MSNSINNDKNLLEQSPIAEKQLLKYAEDLAKLYDSLRKSEKRYHALFEYSPISLWEGDLSQYKNYIVDLQNKGIKDFRKYFNRNPDEVYHYINMFKIIDVNKSTLELYEAESKEEFLDSFNQILLEIKRKVLLDVIVSIAEGKMFEIECMNRTMKNREITVLIKSTIPPGYEETWAKVFFSVHDLTERIQAEFIKKMFGRYLSEDVMNMLIENPDSVKLGGEKRKVTIMMTDLRGFTALSERLEPEKVIQMLNTYYEIIVDVALKYSGTIIEIIGDALLVIFGAPQQMSDRAQRAIACAIAMQNAMVEVNDHNRVQGLPELEMGIGLNDEEVIVGNIGSKKRSKYGVVGSGVNLTGRIESYSVGGQILITESVFKEAEDILRIDDRMEIHPKGAETPLTIYEAGGIGGRYNITLEDKIENLFDMSKNIPIHYCVLDGKYVGKGVFYGAILRLSHKSGELGLQSPLEPLTNIKLNLVNVSKELSAKDFYGKVMGQSDKNPDAFYIRFTSLPPGIDGFFQAAIDQGTDNRRQKTDKKDRD